MPIREKNYPGSTVTEKDLTVIQSYPTGTKVLVTGYTHKGRVLAPTEVYSKTSFLTLFGKPTTDAEFYVYAAVDRIISEGGVPVVVRMPYSNEQSEKYKTTTVSIGTSEALAELATTGSEAEAKEAATAVGVTHASAITTSAVTITNDEFAGLEEDQDFSSITGLTGKNFAIIDYRKSVCEDTEGHGGIFTVVFDPVRALMAQRLIYGTDTTKIIDMVTDVVAPSTVSISNWLTPLSGTILEESVSRSVSRLFPVFETSLNNSNVVIDQKYNNWIGVAVCKIVASDSIVNRNSITILESFVGSVVPTRDTTTGQSIFICDVINSNSAFIKMIANRLNQTDATQTVTTRPGMLAMPCNPSSTILYVDDDSIEIPVISFGYGADAKKIDGTQIGAKLINVFDKVKNIDATTLDVVCDAGLSTIAQFTDDVTGGGYYEPAIDTDANDTDITTAAGLSTWIGIVGQLTSFCSGMRKDCFAVLDAPRHASLKGSAKILRTNNPDSSFSEDLIPAYTIVASSVNDSFAGMYANWVQISNPFTGNPVWVPPSIFASAACVRCDMKYEVWSAPAYIGPGTLTGVVDVSFSPDDESESFLHPKCINYIKKVPGEGYVIWGQNTTQTARGAFDRINVRRSMLRHERFLYQVGLQFVGKENNIYYRRKWIDTVNPYMSSVKSAGGLYDYMLICDETNNTGDVIDNNEFASSALMKPVKIADYVTCQVVTTNTGASFTEIVSSGILS